MKCTHKGFFSGGKKKRRVHTIQDIQRCVCRPTMDTAYSMNALKRKLDDVQHILNEINTRIDELPEGHMHDSGFKEVPLRSRYVFPKAVPLASYEREPHFRNRRFTDYPSEKRGTRKIPKLFTPFARNKRKSASPYSALLQRSIALRKSRASMYSTPAQSGDLIMNQVKRMSPHKYTHFDDYDSPSMPSLYSARYYSENQGHTQKARAKPNGYVNPVQSMSRRDSDEDADSDTSYSSEDSNEHEARADCEEVTPETLWNDVFGSITSFIKGCIIQMPPEVLLSFGRIREKCKDKKTIETINMDDIRTCVRALGNTKSYRLVSRCFLYFINTFESKIKANCSDSGTKTCTTVTLNDIDRGLKKIALDCIEQIPPEIGESFGVSTEKIKKTIDLFSCTDTSKFRNGIADQFEKIKKAILLSKFESGTMNQLRNELKDRTTIIDAKLPSDGASVHNSESSSSHILSGIRLPNISTRKHDESDGSTSPVSTQSVVGLETHGSNEAFCTPYVESVSEASSLHSDSE